MSERDGVEDDQYDLLRATGLTREQCWAILECDRTTEDPPDPDTQMENLRFSGVRIPGDAKEEPDFLEALEMIRELRSTVEALEARLLEPEPE